MGKAWIGKLILLGLLAMPPALAEEVKLLSDSVVLNQPGDAFLVRSDSTPLKVTLYKSYDEKINRCLSYQKQTTCDYDFDACGYTIRSYPFYHYGLPKNDKFKYRRVLHPYEHPEYCCYEEKNCIQADQVLNRGRETIELLFDGATQLKKGEIEKYALLEGAVTNGKPGFDLVRTSAGIPIEIKKGHSLFYVLGNLQFRILLKK